MNEYDEFDEWVANHWAIPLLDSPHALVSVIETKIARAVLAEQRRIIALLQTQIKHDWKNNYCEFCDQTNFLVALIKGENE